MFVKAPVIDIESALGVKPKEEANETTETTDISNTKRKVERT